MPGLSRNSPVQLSLGKDNYEALIERHGQWIRWRTANKCSCVSLPSMQPDIRCKICKGRGVTYTFQKDQMRFTSIMITDNSGILNLPKEFEPYTLLQVYDYSGKEYRNAEKCGCYLKLNESELPPKSSYVNVICQKSNVDILYGGVAVKSNMGFYQVPGLRNKKANIEGVYYSVPSDIIKIGKVIDANGVEYTPEEYRLDTFRIEPKLEYVEDEETGEEIAREIPIEEPVTVENVEYIKPFIFALLNQNLSKADAQAVEDCQGDAVCSYPYGCDVANDDVLTVLSGSYVNKEVCPRTEFETDTLGVFFVYDIISCTGIVNGKEVEYQEGVDFVIVGTNKIKWLDTEICPDAGDAYSITYHALPTYKVVKDIPQIRTSENQRFPKKAVVKLYTNYSENIGVNKQDPNKKGIKGSY